MTGVGSRTAALARATGRQPAAAVAAPSARELAGLAEALYLRLFVVALGGMQLVCVMAIVAALARTSNANFARTAALAIGLALVATLVLRSRERAYRAVRRHAALSLTGPVLALGALLLDGVGHSPLSYPAAVSIALPAFVCGRRWALTAALLISVGAVTGAWLYEGASALNATGQGTIGYFVWAIVLAGLAESFAPLAMGMAQMEEPPAAPRPPLRVPNLAGDPTPAGTGAMAAAPRRTEPDPAPGDASPRLTARQLQVVALLADGLRAEEIADELGIAASTVYRYVERAKARAGVGSRSELIAYAISSGLLPERAPQPGPSRSHAGSWPGTGS